MLSSMLLPLATAFSAPNSTLPTFTVSGHSSGGSMASTHLLAFSDRVVGLGQMQAAAWGCSHLINKYECDYNQKCANQTATARMLDIAKKRAQQGLIAPLDNLRGIPVMLYAGGRDTIVYAAVVNASADFYRGLDASVSLKLIPRAEHAVATDTECPVCDRCGYLGPPFINFCDYDLAGTILTTLLGPLSPRTMPGAVSKLDQSAFFPSGSPTADMGMAAHAFAYVPQRCAAAGTGRACRLHVVYHGCDESAGTAAGLDFVTYSGFKGWAEANDIIVLYPQTLGDACWDWTGTFTPHHNNVYDTRSSPQLLVVNRMVDWMLGVDRTAVSLVEI